MIFGLLFIIAFLLGLFVYLAFGRWLWSVSACVALFVATVLVDSQASAEWGMALIFGIPIVFVGSLLGPYVVELRRGPDSEMGAPPEDEDSSKETHGR